MESKLEDNMTGTLTPACPLCGLRYESSPLLELHIREDHRQRISAEPGRRDPDNTRATPARADSPAHRDGLPPTPSRTTKEVTAMTTTRRRLARQVRTAPRRVIRALRRVNDELLRASEAIIRSARAPQGRPGADAPANRHAHPGTITERADRAA
jgi:hypothetical protein